jgi:hypothetical protein
MEYPDLTEYPDPNKIAALATSANETGFRAFYHKDSNVGYYEMRAGARSGEPKIVSTGLRAWYGESEVSAG